MTIYRKYLNNLKDKEYEMKVYYCAGVRFMKVEAANGLPHEWIENKEGLVFCSKYCEQSLEQLKEKSKAWREKVEE